MKTTNAAKKTAIKTDIQSLISRIETAANAYYNGESIMEDEEFDALVAELKEEEPEHPILAKVGAPVVSSPWKKAEHQIPMGSLDKVNEPEELKHWHEGIGSGQLFFAEKLDGISIELLYEGGKLVQAITRGDGKTGEAIVANVSRMGGVLKKLSSSNFTGSMRGEIILTKTNHQKHFKDKANLRNTASGVSKRLDGVGCEHLDVLLYQAIGDTEFETEQEQFEFIGKVGCRTPNYAVLDTADLVIEKWWEYQVSVREELDYDIDGLVVRLNHLDRQRALGDKDMRPKGAVAFKFANEAKETILKGCSWQCGNNSRITPVALLEPVVLCGATVERASLYNLAYINKLGIGIGSRVLVVRAGDVIPRVEAVITKPEEVIQAPTNCSVCETEVIINGEYIECPNYDCFARVSGRLKNWVSDLDILELGDTLIDKLVSEGLVEDVSDLYLLTVEQLASVERMAETSATNVFNSIWSRNPVPLDILLGALSIPMIGSITIRQLMDAGYNTLERIMQLTQEEMEGVKGIGASRSQSLFDGLKNNEEMIMSLIENGVEIKSEEAVVGGKLAGKSFCFTGAMQNKRKVLQQMVVDNGGSCKDSVGKGLDYLVIADTTTTKAAKALSLGTKLLSEEEFLAMVQ